MISTSESDDGRVSRFCDQALNAGAEQSPVVESDKLPLFVCYVGHVGLDGGLVLVHRRCHESRDLGPFVVCGAPDIRRVAVMRMMVMVHVRPVGVMPVVVVMVVMPMFQSPANKPALPTFQKNERATEERYGV